MSDLISRQAAIDEIRKCRFVVDAIEKIGALPSAQQWIPCSERLPKNGEQVLVSYTDHGCNRVAISTFSEDGFVRGIVDAWLPLPEPYKGEEKL